MPTTEETKLDPTQMIVEEGLGLRQMELVKELNKEKTEEAKLQTVPNPANIKENLDDKDINFDAQPPESPKEAKAKAKEEVEKSADTGEESPATSEGAEKINAFLKDNEITDENFVENFLSERKLPIKISGRERKLTFKDIASIVNREETFQAKFDKVAESNEMQLGTLMVAAQEGNKGAQKKLQKMLVKFTGAEDADGMNDALDNVEEEFNEKDILSKNRDTEAFDSAFADVKSDVDFEANLSMIKSDIKGRMPEKVFESYWNSPSSRKTMYDLVSSGRADEIFEAFNQELVGLPIQEQLEIERDPERYAEFFTAVVRQVNTKKSKSDPPETGDDGTKKKSALDVISSGANGRTTPSKPALDFKNMPKEDFNAIRIKAGLTPI